MDSILIYQYVLLISLLVSLLTQKKYIDYTTSSINNISDLLIIPHYLWFFAQLHKVHTWYSITTLHIY